MKIIKFIHKLIIIELIFCFALIIYYPDQVTEFVGYRFYTVLTDSMEPTIPTYSLVLTKMIPKEQDIQPNTVVTFEANRFGEEILLTHYFRKTQVGQDGQTYYRTQGEGKEEFDNYETKREDIIGKYVVHIPYIGKFFLFLKSQYSFIWYGEVLVIILINKLIQAKWNEKENSKELTY